ncbi:MAG: tetratricopeptide repeat protein, partial [Candidatus Binatia bacterium]
VTLLLGYGAVRGMNGFVADYVDAALQAARRVESSHDPRLRLYPWIHLAYSHYVAGRLRDGARFIGEAVEKPPADLRMGAEIAGFIPYLHGLGFKAIFALTMGDLRGAAPILEQAVRLAQEHRDLETVCSNRMWQAEIAWVMGDAETAASRAYEAFQAAEKTGGAFWQVWSRATLGRMLLLGAQWAEALQYLDSALRITRERRTGIEREAFTRSQIAEAHLGAGELTRARSEAEEGIAIAQRCGTPLFEAFARLALARVLLRSDADRSAKVIGEHLAAALALLRGIGARTYEPFVQTELANLAQRSGDVALRERELREAHGLFLEIGASLRADEVARELEG